MKPSSKTEPRGIMKLNEGLKSFNLARYDPSKELDFFILHYWTVEWDLTGKPAVTQEVISHPNVQLVLERNNSRIWGVVPNRFLRTLDGKGRVFGVKFRAGGFFPFYRKIQSELKGKSVLANTILGENVNLLEQQILDESIPEQQVNLMNSFLEGFHPERDEQIPLVNQIMDYACDHPALMKVEDLAERFGMNKRTLERVFSKYVGVSPKWVINRYRMHEILHQIEKQETINWTQLALDLGYFDQPHFIRDFKAMTGIRPTEYKGNNF